MPEETVTTQETPATTPQKAATTKTTVKKATKSHKAVKKVAHRGRPALVSKEQVQRVVQMIKEGKTLTQAVIMLNKGLKNKLNYVTVQGACRRFNFNIRELRNSLKK